MRSDSSFELVLSQTSPLINQRVKDSNFRETYGAAIFDLARRFAGGRQGRRHRLPARRHAAGRGGQDFDKHKYSRDFLLVSPLSDSAPPDSVVRRWPSASC